MISREEKLGWISLIEDSLFESIKTTLIKLGHITESESGRAPTEAEGEHNKDLIVASFDAVIQFFTLWIAANSKDGEGFDKLASLALVQLAKDFGHMRPGVYEVGQMSKEQMLARVAEIQKGKH